MPTREQIAAAIDRALAPARKRRDAASEAGRGLYPSEMDWASDKELAEVHALQLMLNTHPESTAAAARERAKAKRAARRRAATKKGT